MAQHIEGLGTKAQADTGRTVFQAAIAAGVAPFGNTGEILRADADSGIGND